MIVCNMAIENNAVPLSLFAVISERTQLCKLHNSVGLHSIPNGTCRNLHSVGMAEHHNDSEQTQAFKPWILPRTESIVLCKPQLVYCWSFCWISTMFDAFGIQRGFDWMHCNEVCSFACGVFNSVGCLYFDWFRRAHCISMCQIPGCTIWNSEIHSIELLRNCSIRRLTEKNISDTVRRAHPKLKNCTSVQRIILLSIESITIRDKCNYHGELDIQQIESITN